MQTKTNLFVSAGRSLRVAACLIIFLQACTKEINPPDQATTGEEFVAGAAKIKMKGFSQVNLVANTAAYGAATVDPTLKNGWGLAWSAGGTAWVNSQGGHVSELYNGEGVKAALTVHVPSPAGNEGGNPTGIIFNPNAADFVIPSGNASAATGARFIFVGLDGIVSGWNPSWANHAFTKFNQAGVAVYTGLAIAANNGVAHLYAADFKRNKILAWDRSWAPVNMSFTDPDLPAGYAAFNIQAINGELYVAYAKAGSDGRSVAGKGLGIVNVFSTSGMFLRRFATKDKLNAPWGLTLAPASFFPQELEEEDEGDEDDDENDDKAGPFILVGNFGDGRINVYTLSGKKMGQLKSQDHVISIDKLWAIGFAPTTSPIDQNRLYFAAGPADEQDGLFGYLIKQ